MNPTYPPSPSWDYTWGTSPPGTALTGSGDIWWAFWLVLVLLVLCVGAWWMASMAETGGVDVLPDHPVDADEAPPMGGLPAPDVKKTPGA